MSVIKRMRKQYAVWWERLPADRYGKFTWAEPVEVRCRWDDSGSEYRTMKGQVEISQATVYPDRIMRQGDKLRKGEMETDETLDPTTLDEAFEIQRFEQIPNFRNTETLFIAHLRYGQH